MKYQQIAFYLLLLLTMGGCATGKSINQASEIKDDGKSNVVVLTYDLTLFATDKYPSVKSTFVEFDCPATSAINNCFSIKLPYKGKSEYDGFDLHAFESSGAKVMRMKYDSHLVTKGKSKILIDERKRTTCNYDKKKRKTYCYPVTDRDYDNHRFTLPDAIPVTVTPGTGCYMGHLSIVLVNDEVSEYNIELDAELTPEKLANLDSGVNEAVLQFVDRPCY